MIHKTYSLRLIALLIALPLTAGAQSGASTPVATSSSSSMYVRTEAGVGIINDIAIKGIGDLGVKAGPAFVAALGLQPTGVGRLELQIGHQNHKWEDFTGGASATSVLANAIFTNKLSDKSFFDFGVGFGSGIIRADIGIRGLGSLEKETRTRFMGQLSGLWRTTIAANTDFTLGYRFGYVDGPKFSSGLETNRVLTQVFSAGFRFAF
jgi:hypothetical protein